MNFGKFSDWETSEVEVVPVEERVGMRQISLEKVYRPLDYLLRNEGGEGFAPRGNMVMVTGKAKAGKSYFVSILESGILSGAFGLSPSAERLKILHIDTEQDSCTCFARKRIVHLISSLPTEKDDPRFVMLALRGDNTDDRWPIIKEASQLYKPDVVVIDGIRDLLHDFNDLTESSELVNDVLRLSSQMECVIIAVLHQNKATSDLRGHLGTEATNKAYQTFEVAKNGSTITAKELNGRGAPVSDCSFRIDENGMPACCALVQNTEFKEAERRDLEKKKFETLFKIQTVYTYSQLVKGYMEVGGCKERSAQTHVGAALVEGLISKDEDSNYYYSWQDYDSK